MRFNVIQTGIQLFPPSRRGFNHHQQGERNHRGATSLVDTISRRIYSSGHEMNGGGICVESL